MTQMTDGEDTEVLLATLASLLKDSTHEQADLLNALVECGGDVEAAAKRLTGTPQPLAAADKKRHRANALDAWLKPSASTSSTSDVESTRRGKKRAHSPGYDASPRAIRVKPSSSASAASSSSPTKPVVDLLSVLKPPPSSGPTIVRAPPLTLPTPALVAQHTPCTLHPSILPPELACRLFYTMLDAAQSWSRNKWWLFDRLVESPHRTAFFARQTRGVDDDESWQEAARFWYNGRATGVPDVFPSVMEEACTIIEEVVNAEIRKRKRFPLEWAGPDPKNKIWRANVAASNCYEGAKETVGYHTDALTYLGPYPTIASLSLGTSRIFRVREVISTDEAAKRQPRTYNIPLAHNSLLIMHASTQERFKHTVPPQSSLDLFRPSHPRADPQASDSVASSTSSNCRINITFRFFRPDYRPESTPRCKCDLPTILRPDMKKRGGPRWWQRGTAGGGARSVQVLVVL